MGTEPREGPSGEERAARRQGPKQAGAKQGGLRGLLRRLTAGQAELEAEELREDVDREEATPIASCGGRRRFRVAGTLRTVTLRPRGGAPALEAELYDGSDVIDLVWLGRRKIAGIEPGRVVRAEGLVSLQDGRKVMFNPRYELRPMGGR
jgi:hypothetical protein